MSDLIQMNRCWLHQALQVLEGIDDSTYAASPAGVEPHRAGGHLRHILEFYECFFDGLRHGVIDYDARRRDPRVETSRAVARARIHQLLAQLGALDDGNLGRRVWVKAEEPLAAGVLGNALASSVARELQVLSSHTVHHFALMAVPLRLLGVNLPADFGVAPSTLRHHAQQRKAVA